MTRDRAKDTDRGTEQYRTIYAAIRDALRDHHEEVARTEAETWQAFRERLQREYDAQRAGEQ